MNKLSRQNPFQPKFCVLYPTSAKNLTSAIITTAGIIIDTKFYYILLDTREEALFICTILNSKILTFDFSFRSSTGFQGQGAHIHKRPLDYPIPIYDPKDDNHKKIVELGNKMENRIKDIIAIEKSKLMNSLKEKVVCCFCNQSFPEKKIRIY